MTYMVTINSEEESLVRQFKNIEEMHVVKLQDPSPGAIAPQYSQRDPQWKDIRIGSGNTTIGAYGCVISSFGMGMARMFGDEYLPNYVNQKMREANGYVGTNKNRWVWGKPAEIFSGIVLGEVIDCSNVPAPLGVINDALLDEDIVLVRVDNNRAVNGVQDHWVLVTRRVITPALQDGYSIADPWPLPGEEYIKTIPPAFCIPTWSASRAIFSIVTYRRA